MLLIVPVAALSALLGSQQGLAQRTYFVNTTEDLPLEPNHCIGPALCTLRAAIERAEQGGGVVRACYDPAETQGGKACRGGARPLKQSDAGFDPATGKWIFEFGNTIPLTFGEDATTLDFTLDIEGWAGPQDNKIVIDPGVEALEYAIVVESSNNVFKGFEIRGPFADVAITVRHTFDDSAGASNNQFGPGLILSGLQPAVGIRMKGPKVTGNRFVGNWCGITGDGTTVSRNQQDCVEIQEGSSGNIVGGATAAERNIFAGSRLGAGITIAGPKVDNTIVQGNWFGLDAKGNKVGNGTGIAIRSEAHNTRIFGNVISGNEQSGISIFNFSQRTEIRGNTIGESPDRSACIGNGNYGITLNGQPSSSVIEENRIACNGLGGVLITGSGARANRVSRNSITNNAGNAVKIEQGANGGIRAPTINNTTGGRIIGAVCPGCVAEVYSDSGDEADTYEGSVPSDGATGLFIFEKAEGYRHTFVKVAGIDANNNTSPLSAKRAVSGGRVPTATPTRTPTATRTASPTLEGTPPSETATPEGPSPTPTATPEVIRSIFFPDTRTGR